MRLILVLILVLILQEVNSELTIDQKRRCEQFASLFENSKFQLQYNYVENIHDGRGYTSGRYAFTTSNWDAYEVVRRYTVRAKDNPLAKYVTELKIQSQVNGGDISNLFGYPDAWVRASRDPIFRNIQDDVSDTIYYRPAMILADKYNVRSPLGQCIFYETLVQHGNGDDLDSMAAILRRTRETIGGIVEADETKWLNVFLSIRRHIILHPNDKQKQAKWRQTVDRVQVLTQLIEINNWGLDGPIHIDTSKVAATIL